MFLYDNKNVYIFDTHHPTYEASKKINNLLDKDVLALVVNFVDMLAHDSSKMEVLKEIIPDDIGYRHTVKSWVKNSWFNDVLKQLSESNFEVII